MWMQLLMSSSTTSVVCQCIAILPLNEPWGHMQKSNQGFGVQVLCRSCHPPLFKSSLSAGADPWSMLIPLCLALAATEWQSKTNRWDNSYVAMKRRWRQLIDGDVMLAEGEARAGVRTWHGHCVLLVFFVFLSARKGHWQGTQDGLSSYHEDSPSTKKKNSVCSNADKRCVTFLFLEYYTNDYYVITISTLYKKHDTLNCKKCNCDVKKMSLVFSTRGSW